MTINNTIKCTLGGAALSLAVLAGGVQAQTDTTTDADTMTDEDEAVMMTDEMMTDEDKVAKLQEAIGASAELGQYPLNVAAEDGMVKVTGMIDKLEDFDALREIIDGMKMEGIDNVENEVVMQ